jgi:hypothetical protein
MIAAPDSSELELEFDIARMSRSAGARFRRTTTLAAQLIALTGAQILG